MPFLTRLPYRIALCALCLMVLQSVPEAFAADRATAESLHIELFVNRDGTLDVIETKRVTFEGAFDQGAYSIPLPSGTSISDLAVAEPEVPYRSVATTTRTPQTYVITETESLVTATYAFEAADQERTFIFTYRIHDAITVHEDVAEINWEFGQISEIEHSSSADIQLHLPERVDPDQLVGWLQGPIRFQIETPDHQSLSIRRLDNPLDTPLQIRAIFPSAVITSAIDDEVPARTRILEEQSKQLNSWQWEYWQAKILKEMEKRLLGIQLLAIVVWIAILTLFLRRLRSTAKTLVSQGLVPPAQRSPAAVFKMSNTDELSTGRVLTATLVDFARRGLIKFETIRLVSANPFRSRIQQATQLTLLDQAQGSKETQLSTPERQFLSLIFTQASKGENKISLEHLLTYIKRHQPVVRQIHSELLAAVQLESVNHDYFDEKMIKLSRGFMRATLLPNLFAPYLFLGTWIAARQIRQSRPPAEQIGRLWISYVTNLKGIPLRNEFPEEVLPTWEQQLTYALALGIEVSFFRWLPEILQRSLQQPHWYTAAGEAFFNTAELSQFTVYLQKLTDALTKAFDRALR